MATELTALIQAVESKLEAAPSLGITLSDSLDGVRSSPKTQASVLVFRERTSDLDQTRNQDVQRVEDTIRLDLYYRVKPKDQRTSRDAASDLSDSIRNRVTDLDDTTMRRWGLVCTEETERRQGEWIVIEHRYRARRIRAVGAG